MDDDTSAPTVPVPVPVPGLVTTPALVNALVTALAPAPAPSPVPSPSPSETAGAVPISASDTHPPQRRRPLPDLPSPTATGSDFMSSGAGSPPTSPATSSFSSTSPTVTAAAAAAAAAPAPTEPITVPSSTTTSYTRSSRKAHSIGNLASLSLDSSSSSGTTAAGGSPMTASDINTPVPLPLRPSTLAALRPRVHTGSFSSLPRSPSAGVVSSGSSDTADLSGTAAAAAGGPGPGAITASGEVAVLEEDTTAAGNHAQAVPTSPVLPNTVDDPSAVPLPRTGSDVTTASVLGNGSAGSDDADGSPHPPPHQLVLSAGAAATPTITTVALADRDDGLDGAGGGAGNAAVQHKAKLQRRFARQFPALVGENVYSSYSCAMEKEENWLGRLYLTDRHLCFHGKLNRYLAKVTIRWGDIIRIQPRRDDSGVVDAVKVMSLASKYTLTTFQNDDPPLQEMKIIWQRALEAAQQATQAHRRLDILLRPTSLIGAPGISGGPAVEAFPSIAPLAMPGTLPAASSRHGDGGRGGGERGSANQLSALGQPVGGNGTSSGVSPTPSPSPPPAAGTAPGMAGTPSTTLSTIAVITHPTVANPARGNSIPIASAANTPAIPLTVSSGPISGQAPGSISPPSGGPRDVHPASVSSVAAGGHASGGNGLGPGLVIVAAPSSTLGPGGSVQTPALATAPAIANGTSGGSTIGSGGGGVPAALEATAAAAAGAATGTFRFFSRMVTGGKKRSESASASAGSVAGREMERAAAAAVAAVAEMEGAGAGAGEPPSAVVGLTDPGTDVPTAGSSDRLDGRSAAAAEPPNVMVTPSTPVRSQGSAPSLPAAAAAQLPAVPETTPSPAVVPPPQKQFAPACPCECIDPPLKHSVLNTITAPTSAVAVWRELYGPNAPVFAAAHRARESEALEMPRWRVVTRDDDGVEDESDGDDVDDASDGSLPRAGTERTVSYRVAYYMMGKKLADSTEGQRVVSVFPSDSSSSSSPVPTAFCVESTTKTPNAPYGASFGTLSRVCVHQRAPGVTDVHVRFAVVFSQRVRMMEGKIEQGGVDGCSGLWKEIEKRLRELPADPDEDKDQAVAASSSASQMPATSSVAAGPAPASPIPAKLPTAKPTSPGGGSGVPTKPTTAATTPTAATTTTTTKLLGIIPMRSWKVLLPASRAQARTWKRRMLYAAVALTAANLLYAAWLTAVVSRGVLHLAATNGSGGGPSLPSVIETSPAVAVKVDAKATVTTPTAAAAVVVGNAATAAVLEQWAVSLELRAAALRSEMADLAAMAERVRHLSARSGDDPHIE